MCVIEHVLMHINCSEQIVAMHYKQLNLPIFGDMQQRMPCLDKPASVIFFMPHTSEHPAVTPLISELSERMKKQGTASETARIDDMRENVKAISARLARVRLAGNERETLEKLFRLKDAVVRLEIVTGMLARQPATLIEMHALDRDYHETDRFELAGYFYRIPDTRAIYLRDYSWEYEMPIMLGLEAVAGCQGRAAKALKEMLQLDFAAIRKDAPHRLRMLRDNAGRTMLVGVPATSGRLPEDFAATTMFELSYGYGISLKHTLGRREIDILFSALAAG